LAQIAVRTLWVAGVVCLLAGIPWKPIEWGFFVAGGGEMVLWYIEDPAFFHRPVRLRHLLGHSDSN
jgi:hypothetical protein